MVEPPSLEVAVEVVQLAWRLASMVVIQFLVEPEGEEALTEVLPLALGVRLLT